MKERGQITIETTLTYSIDVKALQDEEKKEIDSSVEKLIRLSQGTVFPKCLYRSRSHTFPNRSISPEKSTLYLYKASKRYRIILSFDDDPVFNQRLIRLFRVVPREQSVRCFKDVATLLYK